MRRSHRRAVQLLRAGVLGRHQRGTLAGCRQFHLQSRIVEHLGDAEIDQPGLTARIHEHVTGLDIPVHHASAVGDLQRLADWNQQRQASLQAQLPIVAIPGNRRAVDPLHDHLRCAVRRGPAIDDPGDAGVVERSQDAAPGLEARDIAAAERAAVEQLDRDPLVVGSVDPPVAIDRPHAADRDLLDQLERPQPLAAEIGLLQWESPPEDLRLGFIRHGAVWFKL